MVEALFSIGMACGVLNKGNAIHIMGQPDVPWRPHTCDRTSRSIGRQGNIR